MRIENKEQMYALRQKGLLSNSLPFLLTWEEVPAHFKYGEHWLAIQWTGKPGGPCAYYITGAEAESVRQSLIAQGYEEGKLIYTAMGPEAYGVKRVLQGEVMRSPHYLYLRYTTVQAPMRDALRKEELHAEGLQALHLLKSHTEPNDIEDMLELLSLYPDAIIEFTVYASWV